MVDTCSYSPLATDLIKIRRSLQGMGLAEIWLPTSIPTLSAVGGAAGAFSKIASVLGNGLAALTFDDDYKISRIRRKEPTARATTDIAIGGKNVVMGFVDGVTGLGKGFMGLVTRPTGGVVDFAKEVVRRVRYLRHGGLVRPYISHEAMGFFILNKLDNGKYAKTDTYVAHITCSDSPPSWFLATSKRLLFVTEISFLEPTVKPNLNQVQILTKDPKKTRALRSTRSFGKMVHYRNISESEARYIVDKITNAMRTVGL
ncbi:unnamed protein product [Adineta steineri]|uniref:Intermembrane lipid transfer protein VPS13-like C-terminal domain-containing protein n=2 Tax=Adineta steineri TaxID=433720 RepID=A0A819WU54_9BILA|nr:unnamed protein product [Adineta steineri]